MSRLTIIHRNAMLIQHAADDCDEDHDPTNNLCTCGWETLTAKEAAELDALDEEKE